MTTDYDAHCSPTASARSEIARELPAGTRALSSCRCTEIFEQELR
jgi:hypothetical protein